MESQFVHRLAECWDIYFLLTGSETLNLPISFLSAKLM